MKRKGSHARIGGAAVAASLLAFGALAFTGCPDAAGDCRNTLSCPLPAYCDDAGDARIDGCYFDPEEESDAQGD